MEQCTINFYEVGQNSPLELDFDVLQLTDWFHQSHTWKWEH